ncbi:seven-hairpin glycosidase [Panus rudis PR-1116 ss-1]|nr:seven-hairpin glycosidase [Panus rudis PR-1116 ss-1]
MALLVGRAKILFPFLAVIALFALGYPFLFGPPSAQWQLDYNTGGPWSHRPHNHRPGWDRPSGPDRPVNATWDARAEEVKKAFMHAYEGYKQHALPHDELLPVSNRFVDNFNGWGVTLIDALDTMWIMGLYDEFHETIPVVANMTFHLRNDKFAPFFETVIRYLGGLLSAYALSNEPVLLSRADDLGKMLLPVFNTSSGLPMYAINTVTGETRSGWASGTVLWAEALSCQMEYKYLAHLTGRRQYYDNVERIMDIMRDAPVEGGFFPTRWRLQGARPYNSQFSVGAFADSAHEYLLKQWLLTSKSEAKAKDLYMRVVDSILNTLLYISPTRHLLYVTDVDTHTAKPSYTFEHLSCFLPGLLTLGAQTLPLTTRQKQLHQWAAEGLAQTCWITYADTATGLGPDEVKFDVGPFVQRQGKGEEYVVRNPSEAFQAGVWMEHVREWEKRGSPGGVPPGVREVLPLSEDPEVGPGPEEKKKDYHPYKTGYLLRPEAVESFYLMWRTTGDEKWRERGWKVFQAIEKETRMPAGYASISIVDQSPSPKMDEMPSFFMAETLKYLYLLFTEDDPIPLDHWVFNTEAHPLPVFEWNSWEKELYNISLPPKRSFADLVGALTGRERGSGEEEEEEED